MANIFDLGGRVAVITGGNSGIGLGMAEALAGAGAGVSIWGRSAEKNEAAKAQLAAAGAKVETRQVDVADRNAVQSAFAETLKVFGRVDACFANAGIGGGGRRSFVERSEDLQLLLRRLQDPVKGTQYFLPLSASE